LTFVLNTVAATVREDKAEGNVCEELAITVTRVVVESTPGIVVVIESVRVTSFFAVVTSEEFPKLVPPVICDSDALVILEISAKRTIYEYILS